MLPFRSRKIQALEKRIGALEESNDALVTWVKALARQDASLITYIEEIRHVRVRDHELTSFKEAVFSNAEKISK